MAEPNSGPGVQAKGLEKERIPVRGLGDQWIAGRESGGKWRSPCFASHDLNGDLSHIKRV